MSDTETGLPPGWAIRISQTYNREYFLNQGTKESSWQPPFGSNIDKLNEYLVQFKKNGYKPLVGNNGKIRASHLLVKHDESRKPKSWKSPDGIYRTRDEAIQNIKGYQEKILSGETKLSELATTASDDLSHTQGGDLGFFSKGQMQPSFEEAAFGLNVGEISDPVESDSGIHLIQRTA